MLTPDLTLPAPIDNLAHIVQTALTPIFLLSGIASLLNVFASRLARVSDRCHVVIAAMAAAASASDRDGLAQQLRALKRRSHALDTAVLLGTVAGGATCVAALLLFVGTLRDSTVSGLLYASFGLALISTIGALLAFMAETLMASRGLREGQRRAARKAGVSATPGSGPA